MLLTPFLPRLSTFHRLPFTAGADLIGSLTWAALALLYAGAVLAVWSLVTYLRGVWVHFRCCEASLAFSLGSR